MKSVNKSKYDMTSRPSALYRAPIDIAAAGLGARPGGTDTRDQANP